MVPLLLVGIAFPKDVWAVYDGDPSRHAASDTLLQRVGEIGTELSELPVPFDERQVAYREMLQLARALQGGSSLLFRDQKENTA